MASHLVDQYTHRDPDVRTAARELLVQAPAEKSASPSCRQREEADQSPGGAEKFPPRRRGARPDEPDVLGTRTHSGRIGRGRALGRRFPALAWIVPRHLRVNGARRSRTRRYRQRCARRSDLGSRMPEVGGNHRSPWCGTCTMLVQTTVAPAATSKLAGSNEEVTIDPAPSVQH